MRSTTFTDRPATARQFAARRLTDITIYLLLPLALSQIALRRHLPVLPVMLVIIAIGAGATAVRWRRFHRLAVFPLVNTLLIALLLASQAISGSNFLWDARTSVFATLSGIVCLASLRFHRPMAFLVCRLLMGRGAAGRTRFEERWHELGFRQALRRMTLVWALAAFARALISLLLADSTLTPDPLLLSRILTVLISLAVVAWSVSYARRFVLVG